MILYKRGLTPIGGGPFRILNVLVLIRDLSSDHSAACYLSGFSYIACHILIVSSYNCSYAIRGSSSSLSSLSLITDSAFTTLAIESLNSVCLGFGLSLS